MTTVWSVGEPAGPARPHAGRALFRRATWGRSVLALMFACLAAGCDEEPPVPPDMDGGPGDEDAGTTRCTSDDACDDGAFCNGAERCAPDDPAADAAGCVAGLAPCAGADETCSEAQDECVVGCDDADGDGHGGVDCGGDDCDDADGDRYPGNVEMCDAAGHDEDCVASTFGPDRDGDGHVALDCCQEVGGSLECGRDCNDDNAEVNPSATEVCNGLDEDCDGVIDEGRLITFYRDADGDGFGDPDGETSAACSAPSGYSASTTDCDDGEPARNPGLAEVCDGLDNDCDERLDAPGEDDDLDGWPDACAGLPAYLTDCDDTEASVNPGASELCNGVDDDCDGFTPGEDADGDSQAAIDAPCTDGTLPRTDCDDGEAGVHMGATETCNGVDDDCDTVIDGVAADPSCSLPHATASCEAGACAVASCQGTRLDCDSVAGNGCEVEGSSNDLFCGRCDLACEDSAYCAAGTCDPYLDWAERFSGDGFDVAASVAVDATGNVYVAGSFRSPTITFGTTTVTNAGPCDASGCVEDILVFSLDAAGAVRWARSFGSTGLDEAQAIAVDGDRVVLAGTFSDTLAMGAAGSETSAGEYDAFVAALAPDTGAPVWLTTFGGDSVESAHGVALDATGDVYVVGSYWTASFMIGTSTLTNTERPTGGYSTNAFVARLRGTDGAPSWGLGLGGNHSEGLYGAAVEGSALYVVGNFTSTTIAIGDDVLTNSSSSTGYPDVLVARFATGDGAASWATSFTGPNPGTELGAGVAVAGGRVFVSGDYARAITVGATTLPERGATNAFVAAVSAADGAHLWATPVAGDAYEGLASVAASDSGALWVTGDSSSLPLEAGDLAIDTSSTDAVLLRLDPADGAVRWGRAFGGTSYDAGRGVALGPSGEVVLTGVTRSTVFRIGGEMLSGGTAQGIFVGSIHLE